VRSEAEISHDAARRAAIRGALAESERLGQATWGPFCRGSFRIRLNVEAHRVGTAREILSVLPRMSRPW
jgi:hypothetical protein